MPSKRIVARHTKQMARPEYGLLVNQLAIPMLVNKGDLLIKVIYSTKMGAVSS